MSEKKAKRERQAARAIERAASKACRLCRREGRPPISSHILPNSFWHFVRENGQYVAIKGRISGAEEILEQTGHPEPLMCRECDSGFSSVENYSRTRLSKWIRFNEGLDMDTAYPLPSYVEVDYQKFKLFYLLLVWRAAMATGPMFRRVALSEPIKERLRIALLTRDVGSRDFCPVALHVESWGRGTRVFYPPESKALGPHGWPKGLYAFEWSGFGAAISGFLAEEPVPTDLFPTQGLDESGRLPINPLDSRGSRHTLKLLRSIVANRPDY